MNIIKKKHIILSAYHKPSKIFHNDVIIPIHVGKSISDINLNMMCDNSGDNISEKNISYAEMTAIYWGWKNTYSDTFGLFHYRRLLDLNYNSINKHKNYYEININNIDQNIVNNSLAINETNLNKLFNEYDIIIRKKESLSDWSNFTVYEHYKNTHMIYHLDLALAFIYNKYPEYIKSANTVCSGVSLYTTNTFIMKRQIFNIYADFIFNILNYVEKNENIYRHELCQYSNNARYLGFLSERLTSIFIDKIANKIKILEVPAAILVPDTKTNWNDCNTYNISEYSTTDKKPKIIETDDKKPIISVIIPAYNVENYIEKALNSVINQTLKNIEIIIVNDGSTDSTGNIVHRFSLQDSRVHIITQKNIGLGFSRNSGMKVARGKYIHFFDSDDIMDDDFLESMVINAEKFNSEIVISTHKIIDENDNFIRNAYLPNTLRTDLLLNYIIYPDVMLVPCHVWDKIYLREFIKNIPFSHTFGEDIPFWWTCITTTQKISIYRTPKINYRINQNSIQSRKSQIDFVQDAFLNTSVYIKKQNNSVKSYFNIFGHLLVLHLLHRSHMNILTDIKFAEYFYYFFNIIIEASDHQENTLYDEKIHFFSLDKNLLYKLRNCSNFDEWYKTVQKVYSYEKININTSKQKHNEIKHINTDKYKKSCIIKELYSIFKQYNYIKLKHVFDTKYYSYQCGFCFKNEKSAIIHYLLYGSHRNINPTRWFNTNKYISLYEDVYKSNMNPFYHYLKYGIGEERITT